MKKIKIGRSSQCDIILADDKISRVHAEVMLIDGQYVYHDLSSNGSVIGGRVYSNCKLKVAPGTEILLAGRVPLPWQKVSQLLPLSGYRMDDERTRQAGGVLCPVEEVYEPVEDRLAPGWAILAFVVFFAGWIMYFAWKDETPRRAAAAGTIGTIVFILEVLSLAL